MKKKKKISLKRLLFLLGACVVSWQLSVPGMAGEEDLTVQEENQAETALTDQAVPVEDVPPADAPLPQAFPEETEAALPEAPNLPESEADTLPAADPMEKDVEQEEQSSPGAAEKEEFRDGRTETGSTAAPETERKAEPETKAAPESESKGATDSKTAAGPERKSDAAPKAETKEKEEPETKTVPETETESASEPAMQADPESETETETELPAKKRSGTAPLPFPLKEVSGFLVTWTDASGETVYLSDKGSSQGSLDELVGTYTLKTEILCAEDCTALVPGETYTLQLDWPSGEEVSVSLSASQGEIRYTRTEDGKEIYIGSWSLGEDGRLTIRMDDNDEAVKTSHWEGYFAVQAVISGSYDEPAGNGAVQKESSYDAASQRIFWTITAELPAYGGRGICSSWYLDDELSVIFGTVLKNDMADLTVTVTSGGYSGEVPPASAGITDSPIAYFLEDTGISGERLYFLTPCACGADHCQNYKDGCKNILETAGDRPWCSCWDYRYNTSFTITYSVDVTPVLQDLENIISPIVSTMVMNQVYLSKDGSHLLRSLAMEELKKVINKEEVLLPDKGNDYTATYQITVNPGRESYGNTDCLTITDSMTNLSLLRGSLEITTEDNVRLEQGEEARIASLGREGNEDRYFSLEASEVKDSDEGVPVQTLLIRIWYPTDRIYTISYDAMVVDPELGRDGSYGNQAFLGEVSISTEGRGYWEAGEWAGWSNRITLAKVDAKDRTRLLAGAEFDLYQYQKDGEDLLLATLTSGEDGKVQFQTDRRTGFIVQKNTLYYCRERKAPPGYVCGEDPFWFYLKEKGTEGIPAQELPSELLDEEGKLQADAKLYTDEVSKDQEGDLYIEIENEPEEKEEFLLPETGGTGRGPGMRFAALFLFAAAVLQILRGNREDKEKEEEMR